MKTFEQFIDEHFADLFRVIGKDHAVENKMLYLKEVIQLVDMWQKLQQTPCSTLRELLAQMLNDEQKLIGTYEWEEDEYAADDRIKALSTVIQMIDSLQPVA